MAKKKGKRITTKAVQETENLPPPALPHIEPKPEEDEDGWGSDLLTQRQRLFVHHLYRAAGGKKAKAAEMAGYRSDNRGSLAATACRLFKLPNVQKAVAHEEAKLRDTPEWARASLVEVASATMANFLTVNDDGTTTLDFQKAAEAGAIGQIREYREEVLQVPGSDAKVIKRSIKLHDRRAAIETLLKLQGKLVERHEVTGANGGPIETKQMPDEDKLRSIWQRCVGNDRGVETDPSPDRN